MQDIALIEYAVRKRRFFIVGEITEVLMMHVSEVLIRAQSSAHNKKLTLYLNTGGGNVCDAIGFCNLLRSMPYEIECICMGEVASAGLYIVAACDTRLSLASTYFLWHNMYWTAEGKSPEEMRQDSSHLVEFSKHVGKLLAEWTGNPKILKDLGPRLWFDVPKARALGILNA